MTKNPIIHALFASSYITVVATAIFNAPKSLAGKEDTVFAPIAMLSLLVLSVAIMGYLFFFGPIQLFIEGKKKEGVDFFLKTLGIFAVLTLLVFSALFYFS